MSDENDNNKRKRPRRRKKTEGEKEALFLKKLRDFGTSPVDDDEPEFNQGMPRNAIRCAYQYARHTHSKHGRTFNPAKMASRTAKITGLSSQQEEELKTWLTWLKDRRYVTREPYQALVLQWALSDDGPDEWSGDENGEWLRRAQSDHAARQSRGQAKATSAGSSKSSLVSPSTVNVGQPSASDTVVFNGSTVADDHEDVSSLSSSPRQSVAFWRPSLPNRAFATGETKANAFFGALRDKPDDTLREVASLLSADPGALSKALSRSSDVAQCIETVFKHFGLPLNGSKP